MSITIPVGNLPFGVAVNEKTNTIYVVNIVDETVSVIDGTNNVVTDTINVGLGPRDVAVNATTNTIYVALESASAVDVIDGDTNTVTDTISLVTPFGIAVNEITNTIYTADFTNDTVTVIDGDTNTVTDTINIGVGSFPQDITVNETTNTVYVVNREDSTVSVIDGTNNTITDTINIGGLLSGVAVNEKTNTVYVATNDGETVSVIDGATNIVIDTIPIGSNVRDVAVNETTNTVFTANSSDTVSVINGTNNAITDTISVGSDPFRVAVNESTNTVYTTNLADNTVSVINLTIVEYQGLAQGPIDNEASSVINAICGSDLLLVGEVVSALITGTGPEETPPSELLPRVGVQTSGEQVYGVVVGGDADGIYDDGTDVTGLSQAIQLGVLAAVVGDTVRVCTKGRCLAKIINETGSGLTVDTPLTADNFGSFREALSGDFVLARLLLPVVSGTVPAPTRIAPVDIQREGVLP